MGGVIQVPRKDFALHIGDLQRFANVRLLWPVLPHP
jgi:hypothetical protein